MALMHFYYLNIKKVKLNPNKRLEDLAEGAAELKLSTKDKMVKNNLRFKFHGDMIIDPPPQSFEDAVEVYTV